MYVKASAMFRIVFFIVHCEIAHRVSINKRKEADSHNNPSQKNKPHNAFIQKVFNGFSSFLLPKKRYMLKFCIHH